jgi:transcriptional regulator with XRE-family HTH domain
MKNETELSLSINIRSIREGKRLTQLYMAQKLNVTQQAYSSMEKNPQRMTIKRFQQIAALLEIDVITLLGLEGIPRPESLNINQGIMLSSNDLKQVSQNYNQSYETLLEQLKEEIENLRQRFDSKLIKKYLEEGNK